MHVLYLLIMFSILFWLFNFFISDRDIMSPSCIFCMVIVACLIMCIISKRDYSFEIHWNTFFVFVLGILTFTLFSMMFSSMNCKKKNSLKNKEIRVHPNSEVKIKNIHLLLVLAFELIVGYFALKYVIEVQIAAIGEYTTLSRAIGTYDTLVKFNLDLFQNLEVDKSSIYSYGWPVLTAITYIVLFVSIYNLFFFKKKNLLQFAFVIIYFAMTFLSGGRTYAFRMITFVVIVYYLFECTKYGFNKRSLKFILKMAILAVAVVAFFTSLRASLGRSMSDYKWYQTLFSYFGAPIVNLDFYLQKGELANSEYFGQETFYWVYNFIGNKFEISKYIYSLDLPFVLESGRNTGNVYTTFYQMIHDFGFIGIIPLTSIIALFYNKTYYKIKIKVKRKDCTSFSLFIYAYLFNDLVMLMFSNKFFETILAINFIVFFVCSIFIWKVVFKYDIQLNSSYIKYRKRM